MSLAQSITDTQITLSDEAYQLLLKQYSPGYLDPGSGPGTELSNLLARFGIKPKQGCKCRTYQKLMNIWGCDGCEQNIDTILGWLREEAAARRLPYLDMAGRLLVRRAIANARRESSRASES